MVELKSSDINFCYLWCSSNTNLRNKIKLLFFLFNSRPVNILSNKRNNIEVHIHGKARYIVYKIHNMTDYQHGVFLYLYSVVYAKIIKS